MRVWQKNKICATNLTITKYVINLLILWKHKNIKCPYSKYFKNYRVIYLGKVSEHIYYHALEFKCFSYLF